ncbi:MAG TPA: hypothetical protein VG871_23215, partial [Vicinamibacterales bacterium]|nr:hypothetical protein [Vicinamibacterales bacterium]
ALYGTAPTLDATDVVYRIGPDGVPAVFSAGYGRPQGLAFDASGNLYVADALAGSSAVFRVRADDPQSREVVLSGGGVLGLAFDPHGGLAVATDGTVHHLAVGIVGMRSAG